ncbi:MAG: hypothetical protein M9941_17395 [Anaerolineae bacterium]|nr:hypothetical protein [Anaerolineae bacterium]MCO5195743.1 hypothetical protein [Anaerolineae bacterium]MCO5199519.1 hypothetical protein [Anaerolineae bacterium]
MVTERYRIEVQSHIDSDWSTWLNNLQRVYTESGNTILVGDVADQAALHGLLARIRDLGLPILLVARLRPAAGKQTHKEFESL